MLSEREREREVGGDGKWKGKEPGRIEGGGQLKYPHRSVPVQVEKNCASWKKEGTF